MDMEAGKTLTNEEVVRELLELLKKNAMKEQANDVFEICSYVGGLEKKIDSMTEELTNMQNQIKEMQEDTLVNNAKLIIGDNYPALLNLLIEYKGSVDVIYIDPPYGKDTMGDFAKTNYENAITRDNLLSMLYPRLLLAKQLLSEDGLFRHYLKAILQYKTMKSFVSTEISNISSN